MSNTEIVTYVPQNEISPEAAKDFVESRQAMLDVLALSETASKEAADLAYQSQGHLYYIALNALLKTRVDASKGLMELHKTKKDVTGKTEAPSSKVTNQNLFVGSTAELLNIIQANKKKEEPNGPST